jgi:RNA recognition motif-containing protein
MPTLAVPASYEILAMFRVSGCRIVNCGIPEFYCSPKLSRLRSAKDKPMTKLYVGNLTANVTNDGLRQLFSDRGFQVSSARIICDREGGRSRGFGFVEFGSLEDAEKAIADLNGVDLEGRALQVKQAQPQEPRGRHGESNRNRVTESSQVA